MVEQFLYQAVHISYVWGLLLGALLVALGLYISSEIFLWTGFSCLMVSMVMDWVPGLPMITVVLGWVLLSILSIVGAKIYHAGRPSITGRGKLRGPGWVGLTAALMEDSRGGLGRVNLKGSVWAVKLRQGDLNAGAMVRVISAEGTCLVVEAATSLPQASA